MIPDNCNGVITYLEPDILECKVKWALGSITMNKANGGDGIPVELLQILKDDAIKVMHSICQQIWKTQQWPQDWKRSVFIPIPKKGNAKEWMLNLLHNCTHFSLVQLLSRLQLFETLWTAACQASWSITNSRSLLKLIESVMPSNHLSSPSPPAFSLSQHQGLFQWISSSHQVAKVREFQLQHLSFQWIFRTN